MKAAALGILVVASVVAAAPAASADDYPLDELERTVPAKGKMVCPPVELVGYRGETVRYHAPVRVYVGFRDRLRKFEQVVRDVAVEVYGRSPTKIVHIGTLNCRRIRLWPTLLSEHGIGNGIDVAGFDFGPVARKAAVPQDLPAGLRKGFSVRVKAHWDGQSGAAAVHARFLRRLTDTLLERQDIFRVLLGPAYPGHKDHFHFDCAPWRLVSI
ncbi:MAG: extensin family protein [Deltaproteobacteria bacterium]|nr:extensin family protein [Deltaproteobacteria bacterium]